MHWVFRRTSWSQDQAIVQFTDGGHRFHDGAVSALATSRSGRQLAAGQIGDASACDSTLPPSRRMRYRSMHGTANPYKEKRGWNTAKWVCFWDSATVERPPTAHPARPSRESPVGIRCRCETGQADFFRAYPRWVHNSDTPPVGRRCIDPKAEVAGSLPVPAYARIRSTRG